VICLGEKRSGDVFTETDRVLLGALADRVGEQLRRFDREELAREERQLVDRLRKFVPGAVRDQLERGTELSPGEREVTVLFVDLIGYTKLSEGRQPDEIFSAVSRYTETVSEIVHRHGGAVVDFSGDGLMVVFGGLHALPKKECAALQAGREIASAVRAIEVTPRDSEVPAIFLEAGVGIATGDAFVGTIRSVEREIWCVLGNTTNLAARLEALTRELDAAVVIDDTTAARCREELDDFRSLGPRPIRGRSRAIDLYALPRDSAPAARNGKGLSP